ncbi:MAG: tRNA (adenosine(37)-N6)-threonylcarbamoyltransferase complex ATPase subunit type 1 TsaE [Thermodesulfobacteriota bacterium]
MALALTTTSVSETLNLGEVLGQSISAPMVIALTGDLGSGKTVFVQGLARGLDVPGEYYITSPSYTLINEYPGRLTLYHADLYRLAGGTDLEDLELLDLVNGKGVVAIEWADRIAVQELGAHLEVAIETTGDTSRVVRLSGAGQGRSDLLREVEKKLR